MKQQAFLEELRKADCLLHRHGGRHDLYLNPTNGRQAPLPHHTEIKDCLCRLIRQQLGLDK